MPIITTERHDGVLYQIEGTNLTIPMPQADTLVLLDDAAGHFKTALNELDDFLTQRGPIKSDAHLSQVGKDAKLKPMAERLIDRQAQVWGSLNRIEQQVTSDETALLAVPQLDNGHTVMGIEDSEVRSYWRGLEPAARLKILDEMQKEPTRHTRIALALLRSPIELIDHEAKFVREVWNSRQRAAEPQRALQIKVRRDALAYGRRGAAQVAAIAMQQAGMERAAVLRRLATHTDEMARSGYGAFGFADAEVHKERMLADHLARAGR